MLILELGGKAESAAVHDAGVVSVVADDVVVAVHNLADDPAVYRESGGKTEGFFLAYEGCQLTLQLYVDVQCAIEESAAGASASVFLQGGYAGIYHALVACKSCVGIATEHQDLAAFHYHLCTLFAFNFSEIRVYALFHKLLRPSVLGASFL